jgi:hypothetical protein
MLQTQKVAAPLNGEKIQFRAGIPMAAVLFVYPPLDKVECW